MESSRTGEETARSIRAFLSTYNARQGRDREIARRIRAQLYRELYRREREYYAEWIDYGGET